MQNPIPHSNLFTTPTLAEVQKYIDTLPAKQKAEANMVFMFTLNACHALVEESLKETA